MIKICFDASVNKTENLIGVGIYDITNNKKISKTITIDVKDSAYKAERIACFEAMKYAKSLGENEVRLFTDNETVSKKECNLMQMYMREIKFSISWIPRELNKEADTLSKIYKKKTETKKVSKKTYGFKNLSYEERLNFLTKISKSTIEKEFVRMLKTKERGDYAWILNQDSRAFIRFSLSIFDKNEFDNYSRKRIKSIPIKKEFSAAEVKSFVKSRIINS